MQSKLFSTSMGIFPVNDNYVCVLFFLLLVSLVLRIRCDAKVSQCPLGEKYGCNPDTEAADLIELAKSLELNVSKHDLMRIT